MNGGIPSRGLLDVGNIPVELKVKIGQGIEPYSVMPLLNGEVHGSGTLVTIDGVHGILTAGHVVRNWHASTLGDRRLGVLPERRASNLVEEPLEHFGSFVIEQGETENKSRLGKRNSQSPALRTRSQSLDLWARSGICSYSFSESFSQQLTR